MIAFFVFVVCMVVCGVLLVAAGVLNYQHHRARRLPARHVIQLTEQEKGRGLEQEREKREGQL